MSAVAVQVVLEGLELLVLFQHTLHPDGLVFAARCLADAAFVGNAEQMALMLAEMESHWTGVTGLHMPQAREHFGSQRWDAELQTVAQQRLGLNWPDAPLAEPLQPRLAGECLCAQVCCAWHQIQLPRAFDWAHLHPVQPAGAHTHCLPWQATLRQGDSTNEVLAAWHHSWAAWLQHAPDQASAALLGHLLAHARQYSQQASSPQVCTLQAAPQSAPAQLFQGICSQRCMLPQSTGSRQLPVRACQDSSLLQKCLQELVLVLHLLGQAKKVSGRLQLSPKALQLAAGQLHSQLPGISSEQFIQSLEALVVLEVQVEPALLQGFVEHAAAQAQVLALIPRPGWLRE